MGYTTEFTGEWTLDRPLTAEQRAYLLKFAETRRMQRDPERAAQLSDPVRRAVGLPIGEEGGYFVGGTGFHGQDDDGSVLNHNHQPSGQPGLWCQWVPNETGTAILWDDAEKFYMYVAWWQYLLDHFLVPWGYVANGRIEWQGEDPEDAGILETINNQVHIYDYVRTLTTRTDIVTREG